MNAVGRRTPFRWRDQEGKRWSIQNMRTTRLFYCLRLIWNHTVPDAMQLPGGRYNGPERWSVNYRRRAVVEILNELKGRSDLPLSLDIQLGIMRDRARELNTQNLLDYETDE